MDLMVASGHSARSLAKKARKSKTIIAEALVGECKKFETLWDINNALGGKWEDLFQLKPKPKSRRAVVRTGNSGTVRCEGAATVGVGRSKSYTKRGHHGIR